MTCKHGILRKVIFDPFHREVVWECVDCGTYFNIKEKEEQDWRKCR